jgi:hypothetical protein
MFVSRSGMSLIAVLTLNAAVLLASQSAGKTCNIRVTVTDSFGNNVKDYRLDLLSKTRQVVRAGIDSLNDVPFGEYILSVHIGCCSAERFITVNDKQLFVRLGVPVRFGDSDQPGGDLVVTGAIRPMSSISGDLWVRVRGIFLNVAREAAVDSFGMFNLGGLDMGTYALEVFQGSTMLYVRTFELDPRNSPFRADVSLSPEVQQGSRR